VHPPTMFGNCSKADHPTDILAPPLLVHKEHHPLPLYIFLL
jgi:hypothetical protein